MLVWTYVLLLTTFVTLVTCSSEEKEADVSGDELEEQGEKNKKQGSSSEVEAEVEQPKMESGADPDDDDGGYDNNDRPKGFTRGFSDLRRMKKKKVVADRQDSGRMSKSAADSAPVSAEEKKFIDEKDSEESGNAYEGGVKSTAIMDGSAEAGDKGHGRVLSDSFEDT